MVSVSEASQIILDHCYKPTSETCSLTNATGRVLAERVLADRDFPPFNRITMDGIGVSYQVLQNGQRDFIIEDVQAAGTPQKKLSDPSKCIEVMTGAIVPEGIDVVIRYEDVEVNNGKARVTINEFKPLLNIHVKGIDVKKNDVIIEPDQILSPAEIALLTSVGKTEVKVKTFPSVSVISTGSELVDIGTTPELHQIRRSNSYALYAALLESGIASSMHHVADIENEIEHLLRKIASTSDVMILSGGVSKGKFDYVPKILEKIGFTKHFHQVSQRPGKPFWFGTSSNGKVVFALPGNPVSTYMCFYKYIKPWLLKSLGVKITETTAMLAEDFSFLPPLTCFLQVKVVIEKGRLLAIPMAGGGSGDFANLGDVDGFLELPSDRTEFRAGEAFPFIPFRKLF